MRERSLRRGTNLSHPSDPARLSRRGFITTTVTGLAASLVSLPPLARLALAADACDYFKDGWSDAVQRKLADRGHRLVHVLWHGVRNSWANWGDAKQAAIRSLGWAPPRPAVIKPRWDREKVTKPYWDIGPAGEDFLYFHRAMIKETNDWLAADGKKPLQSWSRLDAIPAPGLGCSDERVPEFVPAFQNWEDGVGEKGGKVVPGVVIPGFLATRVREIKSDGFFWQRMNWWQEQFKDEAYLRTITLGELGARMELSVHNQMHIRWSAYPSSGTLLRNEKDIDRRWDDPAYDTLFDEYSSHVNPIFFRLHKWLDNRIEGWAEAHAADVERYRTDQGFDWFRDKGGGRRWVQVREPWMGGPGDVGHLEQVHYASIKPEPRAAEEGFAAAGEPNSGILLLQDLI